MTQEYASQQPQGFRNHVEKVAVVGAGGRIGKFIVEELLKVGKHKVTAITRAESTSTSTVPAGVEVKKVDYADQASLVEALRGQDALVITMGARAPPQPQMRLIDAAAAANVPWVFPNEYGYDHAHPGLFKDIPIGEKHAGFRAHIEKLGKSAWIGVACDFWYEYSLAAGPHFYGFDLPHRAVTLFDDGHTRINTSTMPQCGRGVANLLGLKVLPDDGHDTSPCLSQYRNRFVYISSFRVSQRDMLYSVMRPSLDRYEAGVREFEKVNFLGFAQLMYTRVFYRDGGGDFETSRGLQNGVLGLPEEDLDEYTKIAVRKAQQQI
ncbi:MAG: hypothetical protein ALECFALPRED_001648 [Alectoria fallacina]|uniref:NmrA-like domain-containing protein n=1 Tax=Alectoria fallacina TaxID=1903189 RepID=A0A8H3FC47_9LECA|nr:MAG: hypothetical protein ALECFALPRED_001648 [Alectoria fallacina]